MEKLNPKEDMLLNELNELSLIAEKVTQKLAVAMQNQTLLEQELTQTRKEITALKMENQHLREVMQTWRQRLESTLNSLDNIR